MRRLATLLLAVICLAGCMHDDYTGEPFFILEYSLDGDRIVYEDWGSLRPGLFGSSLIASHESAGLHTRGAGSGQSVACFDITTSAIRIAFETGQGAFIEGKRYEYENNPQKGEWDSGVSMLYSPAKARVEEGWYSFSRKCSEPFGRYEVYFEFTCRNDQQTFEIRDGVIKVGRRFQGDVSNLIKKAQ